MPRSLQVTLQTPLVPRLSSKEGKDERTKSTFLVNCCWFAGWWNRNRLFRQLPSQSFFHHHDYYCLSLLSLLSCSSHHQQHSIHFTSCSPVCHHCTRRTHFASRSLIRQSYSFDRPVLSDRRPFCETTISNPSFTFRYVGHSHLTSSTSLRSSDLELQDASLLDLSPKVIR